MAAKIVTIEEIGVSGINIQFKLNDGCSVPNRIMQNAIQSFRIWTRELDHIFIWTDDKNLELSMTIPQSYIGWIISVMPIGIEGDRFRIDAPCTITIESEM